MEHEGIVPDHIQRLKEWTADMLQIMGKDEVTTALPPPSVPDPSRRAQFQQREEAKGLDRE